MAQFWLSLRLAVVLWIFVLPAHAWLTVQVTGDSANVELGAGGSATVTHEALIQVRGGPLRALTLTGLDTDAVFSGIPTLTKAKSGELAGLPIHLTPVLTGDVATFALQYTKGVGSGEYILNFAYTTQLRNGDRARAAGNLVEISWQGLRFDDGVDGLRARFSLPAADPRPRAVGAGSGGSDKLELIETPGGVLLSELQREADRDVLVLTRPHVARKERVTWKILIADSALDLRGALPPVNDPTSTAVASTEAPPPALEVPAEVWVAAPSAWGIALLGSLLYGVLVWLKFRAGKQRALVSLGLRSRVAVCTLLMAGSLLLALVWEFPSCAVGLLLLVLLLAIGSAPTEAAPVRGPGVWKQVDPELVVFEETRAFGSSRWFDIGSVPGLLVFLCVLLVATVVGLRLLGVAPYYSAMILAYSSSLTPLFCTFGTGAAQGVLVEQHAQLLRLSKVLRRRGVEFAWIARYAGTSASPDELRLSVMPKSPLNGFVSLEVGLETSQTFLKRVAQLTVLGRVTEGSPAEAALPRATSVCRGRHPEERVCVLRPVLPLLPMVLDVLSDCLRRLEAPPTRGRPKSGRSKAHPQRRHFVSA